MSQREEVLGQAEDIPVLVTPFSPSYLSPSAACTPASQSSLLPQPQPQGPSPQWAPAQDCPKRRAKTPYYLCSCSITCLA